MTLLNEKSCDVCKIECNPLILNVKDHPYIGMQVCDSQDCKKVAQSWLTLNTITNKSLQEEFGDWVYIHRTNGKKESGWTIKGDAYRESEETPYWILVRDNKRHRSKCVTLDVLRQWNS